ncbi:hypothetical protein [Selenomonas ruminantium]|uniref:hypothetical protein n=1 Tax=Selenomonas ruminantium TaxID=971 RepID=UPI0026EEBA1B|nr:hypothetical protein [Selenomonas ruminantium]
MIMTQWEHEQSEKIIHSTSVAAAGVGAIPFPGADAAPLAAIQCGQIIALGKVFDIRITDTIAASMVFNSMAQMGGKVIAGGLLKLIPGVGSVVNAGVAFSITEAIGWEAAEQFARQKRKDEAEQCARQNMQSESL